MSGECLWCGAAFKARRDGGKAQRFCQSSCRRAFHAALRAWAQRQWTAGHVTTETLKVMLDQRARCHNAI